MKTPVIVLSISFFFLSFNSNIAQNSNWEAGLQTNFEILAFSTSDDPAIDRFNRNMSDYTALIGGGLYANRYLGKQFSVSGLLNFSRGEFYVPINQDLRIIDQIIQFSTPTDPGTLHVWLDEVVFENTYFNWSLGLNYHMMKSRERLFQWYIGLDAGQLILINSTMNLIYRGLETNPNLAQASDSQTIDMNNYFEPGTTKSQLIISPKIGFQFNIKNRIQLIVESYLKFYRREMHDTLLNREVGGYGVRYLAAFRF